ncbi:hypothetical protein Metev_1158 [Methanohalobium evestigatum Z-7303]|uniref:Lipoprotein n=1 Tax=Methanohalobium evestigatum (strain ATCC BAA-1072 / DSM 3721 / NBRC 107634 / OCM 161 / Z-7303) TaxID=644295 RepID=D7E991_METEZ|nr:hypothetical protein [Methanohalobium evestigatum]ADI74039.1 hypothetical protein Metev_1158 [Methanohalobium evestigatum Z-7303]
MKKIYLTMILLLFGVITISGCVNGDGESEPDGIENPNDYEVTNQFNVEEVTITQYVVDTEDSSDVLSELRQSAEDEGWNVRAEWEGDIAGYDVGIVLEKDNEFLALNAVESDGQTDAWVIQGPIDVIGTDGSGTADTGGDDETDSGESAPTTDVGGEDIPDVPRYPDSVRTEYTSVDEKGKIIKYITDDSPEDVMNFYLDTLESEGWTNIRSGDESDSSGELIRYIQGFKEDENRVVSIEIGPTNKYDDKIEIHIGLNEEGGS